MNGGCAHPDRKCASRDFMGKDVGIELAESWNCAGPIDRSTGTMHVVGSKPCGGRMGRYGGRMNRYAEPEPQYRPRRTIYNPNNYYGGNSETKEELTTPLVEVNQAGPTQAGGKRKSKKSKKSRRSAVEYGSMMLYGGKSRKSKKSKKSRN